MSTIRNLGVLTDISPIMLHRVCLGCKEKFDTYYIKNIYCTDSCRKNNAPKRVRGPKGRWVSIN